MDNSRQLANVAAKLQNPVTSFLTSAGATADKSGIDTSLFATLLSTVQPTAPTPVRITTPSTSGATSQADAKSQLALANVRANSVDQAPEQKFVTPDAPKPSTVSDSTDDHASHNQSPASTAGKSNNQQNSSSDTQSANSNSSDAPSSTGQSTQSNSQPQAATATASTTTNTSATTAAASAATADTTATTQPLDQQLLASLAVFTALPAASLTPAIQATPTGTAGAKTAGTAGLTGTNGTDLQSLLAAIKSNGNDNSDSDGQLAGDTTTAATANSATTATQTKSGATASDGDKATALSDKDATPLSFADLFKSNVADHAAGAFLAPTANNAIASASGAGGSSLDLDLQNNSGNSSTAATAPQTAGVTDTTSVKSSGASSFASQLTAVRATTLPAAVEQVVMQLSRNAKLGNDQMTLQLNPAELGKINVKLSFSGDGKVQGIVTADNLTTLNMMVKDQGYLERALQEAGLATDPGSLQFSLGDPSGNNFGQNAGNASGSQNAGSSNASTDTTDIAASAVDLYDTYYLTPSGVNLRV